MTLAWCGFPLRICSLNVLVGTSIFHNCPFDTIQPEPHPADLQLSIQRLRKKANGHRRAARHYSCSIQRRVLRSSHRYTSFGIDCSLNDTRHYRIRKPSTLESLDSCSDAVLDSLHRKEDHQSEKYMSRLQILIRISAVFPEQESSILSRDNKGFRQCACRAYDNVIRKNQGYIHE